MTHKYISPIRFFGSNTKTAAELQEELNTLQNNGIPARATLITMYDIFGSDESKYAPSKAHLTSVTADGKTFGLKGLVRGVANKLGGEHSKSEDFVAMAEYFQLMADSLNSVAEKAEENKELNDQARKNNLAIEDARAVLDAQTRHEAHISPADWADIERDEETRNILNNLQAENTELRSEQSLISKTIAALPLKKKPAAKKTTTK